MESGEIGLLRCFFSCELMYASCRLNLLWVNEMHSLQRDADDMVEFVSNCPTEFKEYYIQMQTAKRSQAPLLSQASSVFCI